MTAAVTYSTVVEVPRLFCYSTANYSFAQQLIYDIIKKIFSISVNFDESVLYILIKGI